MSHVQRNLYYYCVVYAEQNGGLSEEERKAGFVRFGLLPGGLGNVRVWTHDSPKPTLPMLKRLDRDTVEAKKASLQAQDKRRENRRGAIVCKELKASDNMDAPDGTIILDGGVFKGKAGGVWVQLS